MAVLTFIHGVTPFQEPICHNIRNNGNKKGKKSYLLISSIVVNAALGKAFSFRVVIESRKHQTEEIAVALEIAEMDRVVVLVPKLSKLQICWPCGEEGREFGMDDAYFLGGPVFDPRIDDIDFRLRIIHEIALEGANELLEM